MRAFGFAFLGWLFGVAIDGDDWWWRGGHLVRRYRLCAADGCVWADGLFAGDVWAVCFGDGFDALLAIKAHCRV